MDVVSELAAAAPFGDEIVEMHLVSYTDEDTDSERFGLWVEMPAGGAMFATYAPDMDLNTAVAFFTALTWAQIVSGSERTQVLFANQANENKIIVPDTMTIDTLNKEQHD